MKLIHSYLACLAILLLTFTIINSIVSIIKSKNFTKNDFKLGLFTLITAHIQLIIGLAWYFNSGWFNNLKNSTGEVIKNSSLRLLALEHPLTMVIAIILITIGWSKHKKKEKSSAKYKTFIIFYGLALLLLLLRIPWSIWI